MPRKLLRRLLPPSQRVRSGRNLRFLGRLLHNGNLWHLNRYSVAWGVSVGLFTAFVPVPFQTALAAVLAIAVGCNLPIAVILVWVSNPVTVAPLFFFAYKVGAWLLDITPHKVHFEISLDWLLSELGAVWEPLLLGCLVLGLGSALLGQLAVRILWRLHVLQSWRERHILRVRRATPPPASRPPDAEPDSSAAQAPRRGSRAPGSYPIRD